MYGTFATAALLGLSAVAQARPAYKASTTAQTTSSVIDTSAESSSSPYVSGQASYAASSLAPSASGQAPYAASSLVPSASVSGAPYPAGNSSAPAATGTGASYSGGPFRFPLSNGFPDISDPSPQLDQIEQEAYGQLPNGGAPTLKADSTNALGFVAFNELFEVAFFTELVANITANKPGYRAEDMPLTRGTVLSNLQAVLAQEELHELNANGAFSKNSGGKTIQPCTYDFPVNNFMDAIALASQFTDLVLGTLPDVQTVAATAGDLGVINAVGSALGNEGEQNGFYRYILAKIPSQLPFLTGAARNFAFNAILQNFVVSCPSETLDLLEKPAAGIALNETGTLNVLTPYPGLNDIIAEFSATTIVTADTQSWYNEHKSEMQYLTYVNQQNKPLSVPITDISFQANAIHFKASFPAQTKDLSGLTIAAVTDGSEFSSVEDVASATIFGPGLIEIG